MRGVRLQALNQLATRAQLNRTRHRQRTAYSSPDTIIPGQSRAELLPRHRPRSTDQFTSVRYVFSPRARRRRGHRQWNTHTVAFAIRLHCWLICFEINAKLIYTTHRQFIQPFAPTASHSLAHPFTQTNRQINKRTFIHSFIRSFGHSFIHANMQSSVQNSCLFVSLCIEAADVGRAGWTTDWRLAMREVQTSSGSSYGSCRYLSLSQLTN